MRVGLVISVAVVLALGCQRTETGEKAAPAASAGPAESAPRVDNPGVIAYHAAFCNKVLPRATAERLVGIEGLVERRITKPFQARVAECQYYTHAGGRQIEIALAADCRQIHPRLDSHKQALASAPGYRELDDLGIGGVYTAGPGMHRIVFNSRDPACSVYVSAVGTADDPTEKLARHVAAALNRRSAPR